MVIVRSLHVSLIALYWSYYTRKTDALSCIIDSRIIHSKSRFWSSRKYFFPKENSQRRNMWYVSIKKKIGSSLEVTWFRISKLTPFHQNMCTRKLWLFAKMMRKNTTFQTTKSLPFLLPAWFLALFPSSKQWFLVYRGERGNYNW